MSKFVEIPDDLYKQFKAALMLGDEEEQTVVIRLINQYIRASFQKALGGETASEPPVQPLAESENVSRRVNAEDQKERFTSWFAGLTWNGRPYNPVTISGYTGRIENTCGDPAFGAIPVNNLFEIADIDEFRHIWAQMRQIGEYNALNEKTHNGLKAALSKYEEFLLAQRNGFKPNANQTVRPASAIHRWTVAEDEICCKRFAECYIVRKSDLELGQFLAALSREVPDVAPSSLRMKIQNIKYLSMEAGFRDTCPIKYLAQYSRQSKAAFERVTAGLEK